MNLKVKNIHLVHSIFPFYSRKYIGMKRNKTADPQYEQITRYKDGKYQIPKLKTEDGE